MNSRQRSIAVALLQAATCVFTTIGSLYADYQFELAVLSTDGPGYRPSFVGYVAGSVTQLFGIVFAILFHLPPALAAFRMSDWPKFQTTTLVVALVLAINSFVQMLSWEASSQNGCTGCMGPILLQLLFSIFVLVAAAYRSVFREDFKKK